MKHKIAPTTNLEAMEATIAAQDTVHYVLRLYITGNSPYSVRALVNIRRICEEHLQGRYDLEIFDISQRPALAAGAQIIAAPTLIKKLPLPPRRFIGDMAQTDCILLGLDLVKAEKKTDPSV